MKWLALLFTMLIASFVEVTVRASESKTGVLFLDRPIESPLNCYESEGDCLLGTTQKRRVRVEDEACIMTLDENSSVRRRKESDFALLQGQVLLDCKGPFALSTPQAELTLETGRFLVSREVKTGVVHVRALDGEMQVLDRSGSGRAVVVSGLELKVGKVGAMAQVELSPPRGFDILKTLRMWEQLEAAPRQKFLKLASEQLPVWRGNVVLSSEIQKIVVERQMASLRAERDSQEYKKKSIFQERQKLKQLLFKRTFELSGAPQ
jgi:hypothetical protein